MLFVKIYVSINILLLNTIAKFTENLFIYWEETLEVQNSKII